MSKSVFAVVLFASAVVCASGSGAKKPTSSSVSSGTIKGLMKDVVRTDSTDATATTDQGGKPLPDVSKMPFTPTSVKTVITYHQPKVQSCYEETLAGRDKVIEGKLMTSFTITSDGLVKSAKVQKKGTTLRDPKLHDCVVSVLSAMVFPKPIDGRDYPVAYPFNLKAIK